MQTPNVFDSGQPARTVQADPDRYFSQMYFNLLLTEHDTYRMTKKKCLESGHLHRVRVETETSCIFQKLEQEVTFHKSLIFREEVCFIIRQDLYPFSPYIHILTHKQQTAFENIVGKGENARNEQLVLFPQCFLLKQLIYIPICP